MRKYLPSKRTAKAVVAALICVAAYLAGVIPPDVSLFAAIAGLTGLQWLGLVLFVGGAYGITYRVPNAD